MEGRIFLRYIFSSSSNIDRFYIPRPVGDQFSLMVILVMAIGLGLPAIVLILGGVAIAIRNHRNGKDDLLLSD